MSHKHCCGDCRGEEPVVMGAGQDQSDCDRYWRDKRRREFVANPTAASKQTHSPEGESPRKDLQRE